VTVVTARPRARPTPPPRKSHHACWLEAGGDTPDFDVDHYMALMREAGILREPVSLTEVIGRVVARHSREGHTAEDVEGFARILTDELGREGYRIHSLALCVRPKGEPLTVGRPMTPEEEAALVIPDQPRPRRRRS
jgi:hypothetical protein